MLENLTEFFILYYTLTGFCSCFLQFNIVSLGLLGRHSWLDVTNQILSKFRGISFCSHYLCNCNAYWIYFDNWSISALYVSMNVFLTKQVCRNYWNCVAYELWSAFFLLLQSTCSNSSFQMYVRQWVCIILRLWPSAVVHMLQSWNRSEQINWLAKLPALQIA